MNTLEAGLYDLEHQRYLVAEYSPICLAARYQPEHISLLCGTECYALATAIMAQVKKEATARFRTVRGIFEETDYVACLNSMTSDDLEAMRRRIDFRPMRKVSAHIPRPQK